MKLFKRNNMNVDATVDVNKAVEQLICYASQFKWVEHLRQSAITEIVNATESISRKIDKGDVEYSWYANLDNYHVTINLDELTDFIPKDLRDEFRKASKAYTAAYDKRREEKERSKAEEQ